MPYSDNQIKTHLAAAKILDKIIGEAFGYIKKHGNCSEYEVQQFILSRFRRYRLKTTAKLIPIVAFGKNTRHVHYFPDKNSARLKPGSLIMIDIWARLNKKNAVFSDITWMGYYRGGVPAREADTFRLVIKARNAAINFIKSKLKKNILPQARAVDLAARGVISGAGHAKRFLHTTGHSLGLYNPHGAHKGIRTDNCRELKTGIPYTIEPGIYFNKRFGVRSEINFFITDKLKFKITTRPQKNIVLLN